MPAAPASSTFLIGVLTGEGIGPDVIGGALKVLQAVEGFSSGRFDVRFGPEIGTMAKASCGQALSTEGTDFCRSIFADSGAILAGPGGDRFVYDLRKRFDLFCKFSPLVAAPELAHAGRLKPEFLDGVDILLVRENISGLYQGDWNERLDADGNRRAEQACAYSESEVRRILEVSARVAGQRRGTMTVIVKEGAIPAISKLWRDCAEEVSARCGVEYALLNVDNAAYQLIQNPQQFDVIVAPNLFGDVLADLGSVLLGSRGLSFSGNFASDGAAVYQTNHGSGYDLVGKNQANPIGQIYSLAMLLRESFGLRKEALVIEEAVRQVWHQGWRTVDLQESSCRTIGTDEMIDRVTAAVFEHSSPAQPRLAVV